MPGRFINKSPSVAQRLLADPSPPPPDLPLPAVSAVCVCARSEGGAKREAMPPATPLAALAPPGSVAVIALLCTCRLLDTWLGRKLGLRDPKADALAEAARSASGGLSPEDEDGTSDPELRELMRQLAADEKELEELEREMARKGQEHGHSHAHGQDHGHSHGDAASAAVLDAALERRRQQRREEAEGAGAGTGARAAAAAAAATTPATAAAAPPEREGGGPARRRGADPPPPPSYTSLPADRDPDALMAAFLASSYARPYLHNKDKDKKKA